MAATKVVPGNGARRAQRQADRGAQCTARLESQIAVRYQAEANLTLTATKPTVRLGDPLVVELVSGYDIVALHGGAFAGAGPSDQEQSVSAGKFNPSRITEEFWNL